MGNLTPKVTLLLMSAKPGDDASTGGFRAAQRQASRPEVTAAFRPQGAEKGRGGLNRPGRSVEHSCQESSGQMDTVPHQLGLFTHVAWRQLSTGGNTERPVRSETFAANAARPPSRGRLYAHDRTNYCRTATLRDARRRLSGVPLERANDGSVDLYRGVRRGAGVLSRVAGSKHRGGALGQSDDVERFPPSLVGTNFRTYVSSHWTHSGST